MKTKVGTLRYATVRISQRLFWELVWVHFYCYLQHFVYISLVFIGVLLGFPLVSLVWHPKVGFHTIYNTVGPQGLLCMVMHAHF